jgi:hypothetical protein
MTALLNEIRQMRTLLLALSLAIATPAAAIVDNPHTPIDAKKNRYKSITLTWRYADNVQAACNKEGFRRGFKEEFPNKIEACAYWRENNCLIITKRTTNMHTIGHEVLHCFQEHFHGD